MQNTLLNCYQAIEESSSKMLDAAKVRDWDGVVRQESACTVLIAQLRFKAKSETLDQAARMEKTRIMQRILKNDAQIRYLAEPWLAHCEHQIVSGRYLQ